MRKQSYFLKLISCGMIIGTFILMGCSGKYNIEKDQKSIEDKKTREQEISEDKEIKEEEILTKDFPKEIMTESETTQTERMYQALLQKKLQSS